MNMHLEVGLELDDIATLRLGIEALVSSGYAEHGHAQFQSFSRLHAKLLTGAPDDIEATIAARVEEFRGGVRAYQARCAAAGTN